MEKFCDEWLKAWTGNDAQKLLKFYAENCYYQDPHVKEGLRGHAQLSPYLTKLLSRNPEWVWRRDELMPTEKGFTLKWRATIPFQTKTLNLVGLDIVELDQNKITRNEVYFDLTPFKNWSDYENTTITYATTF